VEFISPRPYTTVDLSFWSLFMYCWCIKVRVSEHQHCVRPIFGGCVWRTETANHKGEGSEWEPIKILLQGDRCSNKMNMASNTRLRLNYPSWSRPRSHWSATDPRNQQATFRAKTHKHTQRKLACLAACATPVRPMACAGHTGDTGQISGQSRSGQWLQQSHNKCSREPQWLL
jgi:hypothetical protein